jgi:exosortase A-associated hydrolase 1
MSEALEYPIVRECQGERFVAIVHPAVAESSDVGVVIVVGGPQYRAGSHRQFVLTARAFASAGIPVLRFDYRGMGDSDGPLRTFEHVDDDIRAAIDALIVECPTVRRVVLYGLCDAASAVLMYCLNDRRVAGLIVANPWVRTAQGEASARLWHYYPRRILQRSFWSKLLTGEMSILNKGSELVRTAKQAHEGALDTAFDKGPSFIERMGKGLAGFSGRILVLISERDLTAAEFTDLCKRSRRWRRALKRSNVTVERLKGADHTFSARVDLDRANTLSVKWLRASFESSKTDAADTASVR